MTEVPADLLDRLRAHEQLHVVTDWNRLSLAERVALVEQLSAIDLVELASLAEQARKTITSRASTIAPLPVAPAGATSAERAVGEESLRQGRVAALMVAGGQGSRLGFDKPKGMFAVGPVSGASLFQIHAEKLLALAQRYRKPVPFLVMTSESTDADTREYFEENRYFGLPRDSVIFFRQGMMPAVCARSTRLLLEARGRLFRSPNGHGGTLTALAECSVFDQLRDFGVEHIYYFQVDNPLLQICDPGFIGRHIAARSEASSKVVFKEQPEEKVGVFAMVNGRCGLVEYSDLSPELAAERNQDGTLRFRAGNPAIHLFRVDFLERVTSTGGLPFHIARKSVAHYDPETGDMIDPGPEPNALKFERFIFDALPLAERWLAVATSRAEEFAPLKNASGPDSPETVREAQLALHANWLSLAGVDTRGQPVEVSPLFALDAEEIRSRLPKGFEVKGPTHLR
jgi:UDP-N-acetylglucosamine/UDP-N-acetylgalactosamine diphosphorylase